MEKSAKVLLALLAIFAVLLMASLQRQGKLGDVLKATPGKNCGFPSCEKLEGWR